MLQELIINNFAIIDKLNLEFENGLNILTGETGAGKSIITDALGLVLGSRSSGDEIAHGKDQTRVEALFDISKSKNVQNFLESNDIDTEDEELLLKRVISRSGKNRCYINGGIVSLSIMKEIGSQLVEIHSQNEHHSLMDKKNHIDILDACTGLESIREKVTNNYNLLMEKKKELLNLKKIVDKKKEQKDFLQYKISDIEKLNLKNGEEEELDRELKKLANAEKLYQATREGYDEIYASDHTVLTKLNNIFSKLKGVSDIDQVVQKYADTISSIILDLEDLSLELRDYSQEVEFDQEKLNQLELRLSELESIKRKYGKLTILEVINLKEDAENELKAISVNNSKIDIIKKEIELLKEKMKKDAKDLANCREKAAIDFEEVVQRELKDLNMCNAAFKINFTYQEPSDDDDDYVQYKNKPVIFYSHGFGSIEFLFSSNEGEPLKSLTKIASGGEVSRLMLVIKKIIAKSDKISTMIFDEIDSGTGGKTSEMIGDKLKTIAFSHQVICITHLPQIASKANVHFIIEKELKNNFTRTSVRKLNKEERIFELARMSGGKKITDATLMHAREMIG